MADHPDRRRLALARAGGRFGVGGLVLEQGPQRLRLRPDLGQEVGAQGLGQRCSLRR